ncbi:efflux RND transporter periplasmic adaptor subunit [Shewanella donghaensis]|uniref:efflux RND transporter periplasmic adaptor subunit n=1 Tax=Shewanella donghaensis TaxID=238836 RepID=UPI001D052488|nr:efflux RND transporter periplasmic adaptor subunit [Shewanella donghaensis]
MKHAILFITFVGFVTGLFSYPVAAQQTATAHTHINAHATNEHQHDANKITYSCPMHPEVISHKSGDTCPKCNMFLEEVSPEAAIDHSAETTYICPMHPEVTSHKSGDTCPKCNMLLVANEEEEEEEEEAGHSSNEHAQKIYICPMHPEVTSHKSGDTCPKCNMFLEEVKTDPMPISQVQKTYICPMHPEVTSHKSGDTCPKCNMFLVAKEEEEEADHSQHGHTQTSTNMAMPVSEISVENSSTNSAADKVFNTVKPSLLPTDAEPTIKFVCPMHPHIVSDTQGTCPICGMNLEKVTLGAAAEEIVVGVSGGMQQALGMRTQQVEKDTLWRLVNTIGTVEYNEDSITHVHTRITGWVEKLHINNVGQKIKKGQLMYELYSPELINAQDDYMQAIDYLKQDNQRGSILERKARQRLELLGISSKIIKQLETTGETIYRVPFYAPQDGFVSQMDIRDGMYIQPGNTLIELVDLSTVWVIADVFENEQSWLEKGRSAEVTASAQGLFSLESDIDYIYPELDPVTRAMRVRIKLDNPNESLRPGTLVDVSLFGGPKRNIITIPTEALILTGRENRVVVQRHDTGFTSVPVKVGIIAQGKAEIIEGINEGDHVVVSGQFLLDSEASIQGSLLRLSGADKAPAAHNH